CFFLFAPGKVNDNDDGRKRQNKLTDDVGAEIKMQPFLGVHMETDLVLANQHLENFRLQSSIEQFEYIETLDISCNQLTSLKELCLLNCLKYLNASHNSLEQFDLEVSFDVSTGRGNSSLLFLDISHNKITQFNAISQHKYLETLDISNNQLQDLEPLSKVTSLTRIFASDNQIENVSTLNNHNCLTILDLVRDSFFFDSIILFNISPFTRRRRKKKGNSKKNEQSNNKIISVEGVFPTTIETLLLNDNAIESLTGIESLIYLGELQLENNCITSLDEMIKLCKLPQLQVLNIVGNPLCDTCDFFQEIVYWFARSFEKIYLKKKKKELLTLPTYTYIYVCVQKFIRPRDIKRSGVIRRDESGVNQLEQIANEILEPLSTCEDERKEEESNYWMDLCELGYAIRWEALIASLCNKLPTTVNLSSIPLGSAGIRACTCMCTYIYTCICVSLQKKKKKMCNFLDEEPNCVQHLNLAGTLSKRRWSYSDDVHVWNLLCDTLCQNRQIVTLDLSNCNLNHKQMHIVAQLLHRCPTLQQLRLDNNKIGAHFTSLISTLFFFKGLPWEKKQSLILFKKMIY
ncbi:leucine-rich repeat-containing protein, partial [Reticulomyxa filosa]